MTTFWKLYYKFTLGKDYDNRLSFAQSITNNTNESTNGKLNHFYDNQGTKIRGWHKPLVKFQSQHPLISKYN